MFYDIIKAIILGIVEGVTEFLPVSSTGHLIIVSQFLKVPESFETLFDVFIQVGAITAVVFYYKEKIFESLRALAPGEEGFALWSRVFVAFLPAAVLGILFNDIVEKYLFNPVSVALALIIGAFLMMYAEVYSSKKRKAYGQKKIDTDHMTYRQAFNIGMFQCLALIPGMSRSASTIIGGLVLGMTSFAAADFSFFLALPTISAASAYSLFKYEGALHTNEIVMLGVGLVVSFVVALLVIRTFMGYLKSHSLRVFAFYRIVLGLLLLLFFALS